MVRIRARTCDEHFPAVRLHLRLGLGQRGRQWNIGDALPQIVGEFTDGREPAGVYESAPIGAEERQLLAVLAIDVQEIVAVLAAQPYGMVTARDRMAPDHHDAFADLVVRGPA